MNELSPQEHDDLRDLVIAGTQRITPAWQWRGLAAASVAVVLIAGAIGGGAAIAWNAASHGSTPATPAPSASAVCAHPTPLPSETRHPVGADMPPETVPSVAAPAPGERVTLRIVPKFDDRMILGTSMALDAQGIDVLSARGFESVGGVWPWTANLKNGCGACILIRESYEGGWSQIDCDKPTGRATVWTGVAGTDPRLRLTITGGAIVAFNDSAGRYTPFDPSSVPAVQPPPAGGHATLHAVPKLDGGTVLGWGNWMHDNGYEVATLQGFELMDGVSVWTIERADGAGWCLWRRPGGSGSIDPLDFACDTDGMPAQLERRGDGGELLRFTIAGDTVDVYTVPE